MKLVQILTNEREMNVSCIRFLSLLFSSLYSIGCNFLTLTPQNHKYRTFIRPKQIQEKKLVPRASVV